MAFDLSDCQFQGPALPEPFVKLELEKELIRLKLLPKTTGTEGKKIAQQWDVYRRKLRELMASGGALRVRNHVIEPIQALLGYSQIDAAPDVQTREDLESGGALLITEDGKSRLRIWTTSFDEDLYAPSKRGRAYRYSHLRVAQRVLLASGERIGILANGVQMLVLISDPARPDSTITIPLDPGWKRSRDVPDSFRLLIALASPKGVAALPDLVEKARLQQTRVTKELRKQAREAVERFIQEILDHPANQEWFKAEPDHHALARTLWREGLVTVYRLLFLLKLEASDDLARSFSFASTSLWRNTFSPSMALARYAHDVLERGLETGKLLESGLRTVFRMFEEGLECTELVVKPLGGALFGANAAPTLAKLTWGEHAAAWLLDRLLWTPQRRGENTRQRVHYGPLDVEDLGRVYEALLELEPGITSEPMCRLRRQKLEVVVPLAQGDKYRPVGEVAATQAAEEESDETNEEETEDEEQPSRGKKTKVEWIESIPPGRFYLRVGLGRKASGSYYTPHSFVRFLVQETLGPQVAERSPQDNPQPLKILKLKVLDPAMGSGHFLVEACRFLGEKLYEACRLCDDKAVAAERRAEKANKVDRQKALEEASHFRQRVLDIPDPDDELVKYLPSRSPEGEQSGFSQQRAEALCRRLVATHCLYGVDKNPLAVELAKLALWLESHAEGMPLTFLDHRLVVGDSLTGPFWDKLIFRPGNPSEPIENLFNQGLNLKLSQALHEAIRYVHRLEATVGITVAEMREKEAVKADLDRAIRPFCVAAAAWSGGVMLGPDHCDDGAYSTLLQAIGETGEIPDRIESDQLCEMIARGLGLEEVPPRRDDLYGLFRSVRCVPALPYDLTFPEVFYPTGVPHGRLGFNAVLGNPPWEGIDTSNKEFFASFDFSILELKTDREINVLIGQLMTEPEIARLRTRYEEDIEATKRLIGYLYLYVNQGAHDASAATPDLYQLFIERGCTVLSVDGFLGMVLPSAFHSNEGAAGIRRLLLQKMRLHSCFSFENRRLLFEIHRSFKFAPIVAKKGGSTDEFMCRFYLHDDQWLYSGQRETEQLRYTLEFVQSTTGDNLNFLELRSQSDVPVAEAAYGHAATTFGRLRAEWRVRPTEELHLSKNRWRLVLTSTVVPNSSQDCRLPDGFAAVFKQGVLPFYEGKSVHQFTDCWEERPTFCVPIGNMVGKERRLQASRFFRLCFRTIGRSTDERAGIFAVLPPGALCSNSVLPEADPEQRANWKALTLLALANSYPFDWLLRLAVSANITFNFLDPVPVPQLDQTRPFLSHAGLRLSVNHARYEPLWQDQLGHAWREQGKKPHTWPVLAEGDERWALRAMIDAVVADVYVLSRDQYAHVLSTFSHASYPKAPELCLARFDELKQIGLEAFTKKHDPYWDIPLNENLPQPVIDLPIPAQEKNEELFMEAAQFGPQKKRKKTGKS